MEQNIEESSQQENQKDETQVLTNNKHFVVRKDFLLPAGIILALFIVIPIILLLFSHGATNKTQSIRPTPPPQKKTLAIKPTPAPTKQSQTLVYGTWTSQTSAIRAMDIASDQTTTIATLPLTIKKVTILSPNTLIYIDETDNNDFGQRISIYNLQQKQIVVNIPADSGFKIDEYLLSPNKKYLVVWEKKLGSQTQTLQGGASRVFGLNLSQPTLINVLYDETVTPTIPIHYPRAILNDGTVLTDQMIPNDKNGGTGWAYGMSVVNFDGSNKQDIQSMTNGTYGTQPLLSPDGKYLLFAGYDGKNGNGTSIKNGYRQALLTPNTVELLDTSTFTRYKLSNLPDTNTYSDVQWDQQTSNVILSVLSPDNTQTGVYSYNVEQLHATPIPLSSVNGMNYGYVSGLTTAETLIGIQSTNNSNLGNLGQIYTYAYTQFAELNGNGKLTSLFSTDPFMQYITTLPANYFTTVLGAQTNAVTPPQPPVTYAILQGTNNTTQDTTFQKTTLANRRLQLESNQDCLNLGAARCSALGLSPNSSAYTVCQTVEKLNNTSTNACY